MKTKSLLLSLLILALSALPAMATVDFPDDSADLSANAYIDDYNFVAQGYGDFAGGDYVGTTSGTATYDKVNCAVVSEHYKVKSGGLTYTVNLTYYLARDNNDDIRVLYYQGTVKSSFQTYTIANQELSGDDEIFIPNEPSVNATVF